MSVIRSVTLPGPGRSDHSSDRDTGRSQSGPIRSLGAPSEHSAAAPNFSRVPARHNSITLSGRVGPEERASAIEALVDGDVSAAGHPFRLPPPPPPANRLGAIWVASKCARRRRHRAVICRCVPRPPVHPALGNGPPSKAFSSTRDPRKQNGRGGGYWLSSAGSYIKQSGAASYLSVTQASNSVYNFQN